jgi:NAD(P)H-dependent FMN reductase
MTAPPGHTGRFMVLAMCGSLRAASTNRMLLAAARALAPPDIEIVPYDELAQLPPFNPDLEDAGAPDAVGRLQAAVRRSDGLLIACPEYAHGVPGAFKNALDWLVGMPEFPGKPVALLNAAPRATIAQAALVEILSTMSARVVPEACVAVQVLGSGLDEAGILADPCMARSLAEGLDGLRRAMLVVRLEASA